MIYTDVDLSGIVTSNEFVAAVAAVFLTFLLNVLYRIFVPKGRLAWGLSHNHSFYHKEDDKPAFLIKFRQIWIQNVGRATVDGVEVILGYEPQKYNIWPAIQYRVEYNAEGQLVVSIDHLSKREYFTISMMNIDREHPLVLNVRWKGGVAAERLMSPQQVLSRYTIATIRILFVIGIFSTIYLIILAAISAF